MRFPNPDMLVYIGMADAYGMAAEYLSPQETPPILEKCLAFKEYIPHPRHGSGKGRYTDDTEMSIANAQVLTLNDPPFTPIMFADAYVKEFNFGGRRKGYSKNFQTLLEDVKTGEESLARLAPSSTKNGAAMRSVPIGALRKVEDVLAAAEVQAKITHDTPEGIFSAKAVALMSHYALYEDEPMRYIPSYCLENLPGNDVARFGHIFRNLWPDLPVTEQNGVPVGITTVHAVVDLIAFGKRSLFQIMEQALRWGGDTDSVAAIAWGIVSARHQHEKLPLFFWTGLESGYPTTGVDRLFHIGSELMKKYGR